MNNQHYGSSHSLMNYDLVYQVCKAFSLPLTYASMPSVMRLKNREDINMANYRLGSMHAELLSEMKMEYLKPESDISGIANFFISKGIIMEPATGGMHSLNDDARVIMNNNFIHKDRQTYFKALHKLISKADQQVIFIDPDTGIALPDQDIPRTKGASLLAVSELKEVLDVISGNSVVIVRQVMNNHYYGPQKRITDLQQGLAGNVTLLTDQVIQSGLYFITRDNDMMRSLVYRLQEYLTEYKKLKSSNKILLGYSGEGEPTISTINSLGAQ